MKHVLTSAMLVGIALPTVHAQSTYIRVESGQLPIILSAPHGGYLAPGSMKDRSCAGCTLIPDDFTLELTEELARALFDATGKRPYSVINLLDRIKLDANRDIGEAADGDPSAEAAWLAYHDALTAARAQVTAQFGKGLVLDIHGHGHDIQRLELGYLPDEEELRVSDADLNASRGSRNTFNSLVANNPNGYTFAEIIRGPKSLGQLYENRGYPAVPSQSTPFPLVGEPYFAGGYITQRHGSRNGGSIDAVQIEANRHGVRHTADQRRAFADSTAKVLIDFFEHHYGIDLRSVNTSADRIDVPETTRLHQNYPNPFNPSTVIRFELAEFSATKLTIHDVLGREVAVLLDSPMPAGTHHIVFNASPLTTGIYLYRLQTPSGTISGKMHLVK
jgi:N-formylglutamate amidohydrolase